MYILYVYVTNKHIAEGCNHYTPTKYIFNKMPNNRIPSPKRTFGLTRRHHVRSNERPNLQVRTSTGSKVSKWAVHVNILTVLFCTHGSAFFAEKQLSIEPSVGHHSTYWATLLLLITWKFDIAHWSYFFGRLPRWDCHVACHKPEVLVQDIFWEPIKWILKWQVIAAAGGHWAVAGSFANFSLIRDTAA